MGDSGDAITNNTIKQIFENMEYGDEIESTAEAIEWIKAKEKGLFAYIDKPSEKPTGEALSIKNLNNNEVLCNVYFPEAATIDMILKKAGEAKNKWFEVAPIKRAEILYKLGDEIRKKQNLFVQLEMTIRGILSKDTKKALPLLTDYLQYYSSYCVKHNTENSSWKPEGLCVGILSNKTPLSALGSILGPSLAAGYHVIIQVDSQLSPIVALLIDLSVRVGIPEDTLRLIPGNVDLRNFFTHPKVSVVSIFGDIHKEEYLIANHFNKKLLSFSSSGIPMLVFENADLDSACQSITDAVWAYKGMLPWSVRNIYVQENVFKAFEQKLKHHIKQIKIDQSNKKNTDISYPDSDAVDKLKKIIEKAKNHGIEIHQNNPDSNNFTPTLLIGGNIFNNVIKEDFVDIPVVTLTAFRTINEGVALANNTRQGLAVSVWTENTSLVNEIIPKLKFGNIWVNSHGLFSASIPVSPYKTSGNGYFGGKEGFYEYVRLKTLKNENISQIQNGDSMEKSICEAKKAQGNWFKLSRFVKIKKLQTIAQNINTNRNSWGLPEKWLDDWIVLIHDYISNNTGGNFTADDRGYNVVTIREPCGIIAVEMLEDMEFHNKRLIIAALAEGNAVIILNESKSAILFYSSLAKMLPQGVCTVLPHSQDATKIAALHKELNVYFGEKNNNVFRSLPLKTSSKFKVANNDNWDEVRNKVTFLKNVWLSSGQSFI